MDIKNAKYQANRHYAEILRQVESGTLTIKEANNA
jgi:hypothetical protein